MIPIGNDGIARLWIVTPPPKLGIAVYLWYGGGMSPKRPAKLIERKLGRENAEGLVEPLPSDSRRYKNAINVDPRLKPKAFLGAVIHELIHIAQPHLTEETVIELEKFIASSLWSYGYRRVQQ